MVAKQRGKEGSRKLQKFWKYSEKLITLPNPRISVKIERKSANFERVQKKFENSGYFESSINISEILEKKWTLLN